MFLGGALNKMVTDLPATRRDAGRGKLCGLGFVNEGLGYNPVAYDLLYELAWREESVELDAWIKRVNTHSGLEFEYDEERVWGRSDHYCFASKGVPAVFFFSGFHADYHQPSDTIEKINFDKVIKVCRLVLALTYEVADRKQRLRVNRV